MTATPHKSQSLRHIASQSIIGIALIIVAIIANRSALSAVRWFQHNNSNAQPNLPTPQLIIAADLSIGSIYEGGTLEHVFRITNPFEYSLTITHFNTSCDCASIVPLESMVVAPRQTAGFRLMLKPRTVSPESEPWDDEPFHVRVRSNYTCDSLIAEAVQYQFSGLVKRTIRFRPSSIDLGRHSRRRPLQDVIVTADLSPSVRELRPANVDNWVFEVHREASGTARSNHSLHLRFVGTYAPQDLARQFQVVPLGIDGQELPARQVTIHGKLINDVIPVPESLHFGRRTIGDTTSEPLVLRSMSGHAFQVVRASSTANEIGLSAAPIPVAGHPYLVTAQIAAKGLRSAALDFDIRDDDGVEYRIMVPVHYEGKTPD